MHLRKLNCLLKQWLNHCQAHKDRLNEYHQNQRMDAICSQLITFCQSGWPTHKPKGPIGKYWQFQGEFQWVMICYCMAAELLCLKSWGLKHEKIHGGHQGIQKCRLRAKSSMWWQDISKEIDNFVTSCPKCKKYAIIPREPLLPIPLPNYPWERVACDLFELEKTTFILVVDYFSHYVEVQKLTSTTSTSVITVSKAIFSHRGFPVILVTDNGPQFTSE